MFFLNRERWDKRRHLLISPAQGSGNYHPKVKKHSVQIRALPLLGLGVRQHGVWPGHRRLTESVSSKGFFVSNSSWGLPRGLCVHWGWGTQGTILGRHKRPCWSRTYLWGNRNSLLISIDGWKPSVPESTSKSRRRSAEKSPYCFRAAKYAALVMIFLFRNYCQMQCILGFRGGKVTFMIFDHSSTDYSFAGDQNHSSFSLIFEYFCLMIIRKVIS